MNTDYKITKETLEKGKQQHDAIINRANKNILKKLGAAITVIRQEKDLTQRQLAEKINTKQAELTRIECGRQNVSIKKLKKIVEALDYDLIIIFKPRNT